MADRIKAIATYLTKAGASDVRHDEAWSTVTDLCKLRNLITHRAGTRGSSLKHRKTVDRLLNKYQGDLEIEKTPMDWWNEVGISMELCRRFTNEVEAFLGRVVSDVNALQAGTDNRVSAAVSHKVAPPWGAICAGRQTSRGLEHMSSYPGTRGSVRVGGGSGVPGGGIQISIHKSYVWRTTLEWREARSLAYAILRATDKHVDQKLKAAGVLD